MNIFKKYKRNGDLIVNGAACVIGVDDKGEDVVIMVARSHESYPVFKVALQDSMEKNKDALDSLGKTDKKAEADLRSTIVLDVLIDTCIKGWKGLTDEDDSLLEYNEANVQKLKQLPELVEKLWRFSNDDTNYIGSFDEKAAVKN